MTTLRGAIEELRDKCRDEAKDLYDTGWPVRWIAERLDSILASHSEDVRHAEWCPMSSGSFDCRCHSEDVEGVGSPGGGKSQTPAPSALPVELEHVHRIELKYLRESRKWQACPGCLSVQELLRLLLDFYKAKGQAYEPIERKLRGSVEPGEET